MHRPATATDHDHLLPNFCNIRWVLACILMAELLAFLLELASTDSEYGFWSDLGLRSLFILWIALTSEALLCGLRRFLCGLNDIHAGILAFLVIQAITVVVSWMALDLLPHHGLSTQAGQPDHPTAFYFRNVGISSIVAAVLLRYLYMQHQWKAQIKAQSEARLAVLQSRIRPHFLFNSLNTIAHLIRSAPDIAEELVQDLAELFRASLKTDAKPDLVLLDIRMPVMDGIEAAQALTRLDEAPAVIFVTAYDEHALQAFDANAIDYLLKPIRQARLEQALEKISLFSQARRQQRQRPVPLSEQQPRTHICATAGGRLLVIPVAQVRYCRADQKYVAIRTDRQELLVDESLKALAREFPRQFIRVHRNALVSVGYIETLEKSARGRFQVKLQGIAEPVEVSRRHLSSLRAILKHGLAAERSTPY